MDSSGSGSPEVQGAMIDSSVADTTQEQLTAGVADRVLPDTGGQVAADIRSRTQAAQKYDSGSIPVLHTPITVSCGGRRLPARQAPAAACSSPWVHSHRHRMGAAKLFCYSAVTGVSQQAAGCADICPTSTRLRECGQRLRSGCAVPRVDTCTTGGTAEPLVGRVSMRSTSI